MNVTIGDLCSIRPVTRTSKGGGVLFEKKWTFPYQGWILHGHILKIVLSFGECEKSVSAAIVKCKRFAHTMAHRLEELFLTTFKIGPLSKERWRLRKIAFCVRVPKIPIWISKGFPIGRFQRIDQPWAVQFTLFILQAGFRFLYFAAGQTNKTPQERIHAWFSEGVGGGGSFPQKLVNHFIANF